MIPLAAITTGEGAIIGTLVLGIGTLLSFLGKLQRQQDRIVSTAVEAAMARVHAEQKTPTQRIEQPLEVTAKVEFVPRLDFHKHAQLNREAHDKIEKEFRDAVLRIDTQLHQQAVSFAASNALREENGARLSVLVSEFAEMKENFGELSGAVHQALKIKA
jgi:hypothetical protein